MRGQRFSFFLKKKKKKKSEWFNWRHFINDHKGILKNYDSEYFNQFADVFLRARVRAGVGSVQRLASAAIFKPVRGRHRILLIFVYKPQPG